MCSESELYSTEIQSQSMFEVYIELRSRFYNLVSLKYVTVFLKFVATFRSFTSSVGAIENKLCLNNFSIMFYGEFPVVTAIA